MSHQFELRSLPAGNGKNRLFLLQLPLKTAKRPTVDVPTTIGRLEGTALEGSQQALGMLLKDAGITPDTLAGFFERDCAVRVSEAAALRLALAFSVIPTLRSAERMHAVVEGIAILDEDQAAMWLNMVSRENSDNGRMALLVFLTGKF